MRDCATAIDRLSKAALQARHDRVRYCCTKSAVRPLTPSRVHDFCRMMDITNRIMMSRLYAHQEGRRQSVVGDRRFRRLLERTATLLHTFNSQELGNTINGLARLNFNPGKVRRKKHVAFVCTTIWITFSFTKQYPGALNDLDREDGLSHDAICRAPC
jgi:hypothetical protein